MSPWDPLADKFAAIWAVLGTLTSDTAQMGRDIAELKRTVFGPNEPEQDREI